MKRPRFIRPIRPGLALLLLALLILSALAERQRLANVLRVSSAASLITQSATTQKNSLTQSRAQSSSPRRTLPDFDIRADRQRSLATPPATTSRNRLASQTDSVETENKTTQLQRAHPLAELRWNSVTATPSRVYSSGEALSDQSRDDAETTARRFLKTNRDLFRLTDDDVNSLRVARQHTTAHNGLTHLTLAQRFNGIEVFESRLNIHLNRDNAIIATTGELLPDAARAINRRQPRLTSIEALQRAAAYAEAQLSSSALASSPAIGEEQQQSFSRNVGFEREVNARLVYFPLAADTLRLAWEFELWMPDTPDAYLIIVDAERGSLLFRYNLTCYEENPLKPHGLVYTTDSPRPDSPRSNDTPPTVERQDVRFQAAPFNGVTIFALTDPHFDWWAGVPGDSLISNNVDAHLDRDANNLADLPLLKASDGNFSYPIDLTLPPSTENNLKAAQVNLFYWINRYHDILYQFGFTEAAGNFQSNNFGLGGGEGDAIQADAQDGSGTNNANFSTPPDGRPGRVQMYLWNGAPQLDGDLDQTVILHELTHGLSNRLIGNSTGLSGFQPRSLGEGWSDFVALVLLAEENDPLDGAYVVGQYVRNNYTAGIRRFAYSTNKNIYPYTFGNLNLSTSVHAGGELWCVALWELRAALIQQYGFRAGQRQSLQLVVDAMKLTPPDPTFIDARDAILLTDRVNHNGANQCLLWQAFAKHGLGYTASTSSVADSAPKESFDVPPYCSDTGSLQLDKRNYVIGEAVRVTVGDRNAATPVQIKVTSSATGDSEVLTLNADPIYRGSFNASLRLVAGKAAANDGRLQASVEAGDFLTATYEDLKTEVGSAAPISQSAGLVREKLIFEDNVEQGNQGWMTTGNWAMTKSRAASANSSWTDSPTGNSANNSDTTLVSPLFDFSGLSEITLTIAHSYDLENRYDFGLVEYSINDGASWTRATSFTGKQSTFLQSQIKLDALANQPRARIRFRLLTDAEQTGDGWFIDDIRLLARSANAAVIKPANAPAPIITEISPAFAAPAGGTLVIIAGQNFTDTEDTTISFDGLTATNVNVLGSTTMTATVPPHVPGAVIVRVTNRNGTAVLPSGFTYYSAGSATPAPRVSRVYPDSGSVRGGTSVLVFGESFTPETKVTFGAQTAAVTFINANTLRVISPAQTSAGAIAVSANNGANSSTKTAQFNYTAPMPPTIQLLSPNGGEAVYSGALLNIRWQSSDNSRVMKHRVQLVRNDGAQLTTLAEIASDLPGETMSFNWSVPFSVEATSQARIRVIAIDDEGETAEAVSSGDFMLARRWDSATPLPFAVQRLAAVTDGRFIYVIGGRTAMSNTTTIETAMRFDPLTNAWTTTGIAPMLAGLSSGDAVYLKGKIYLPGGITMSSGSPVATHFVFDVNANTWTQATQVPAPMFFYALVADEARGVYYLTGGNNNLNGAVSNVLVFDPAKNQWSELPPMLTARYGHEAAMIQGKLYVAGGFGVGGGLSSGEAFDFSTQRWTTLATMNRARRFATNAIAKDSLGNPLWLMIGGEDPNTGTPLGNVEAYDIRHNRWIAADGSFDQITPRTHLTGATVNGNFYAIGGAVAGIAPGSYPSSNAVERIRTEPLSPMSSAIAPVLAVPAAQTAIAGYELKFNVTASDLNSNVPLVITAQDLPNNAKFTATTSGSNHARSEFRWTPGKEDAGKTFTLRLTASDGSLSETKAVTIRVVEAAPLAVVSAADYRGDLLAPDSLVTAFGNNLAVRTEAAQTQPLPLELAGTFVTVSGVRAPLLFVSPNQINFAMPPSLDIGEAGQATIIVHSPLGNFAVTSTELIRTRPALFTADASGTGDAAAQATPDGLTYQEPPFDVVMNGRANVLVLYGTGFRHIQAAVPDDENGVAEAMTVTIGGQSARVLFAGAHGQFAGLDQLNVELPQSLLSNATSSAPRRLEIIVTINGVTANRVTVMIK